MDCSADEALSQVVVEKDNGDRVVSETSSQRTERYRPRARTPDRSSDTDAVNAADVTTESSEDEPSDTRHRRRNRPKKNESVQYIEDPLSDKGVYFYTGLAKKAYRMSFYKPWKFEWYHGLLHRWIAEPWRKLWSPRV